MPNENQTAETTVNNVTDDSINAGAVNDENDVNDTVFTDSNDNTDNGDESKGQEQTKEQNSQNARIRREAERKAEIAKAKAEARNQAIIEALDGINPYTNEEMTDSADVEEYLAMKEIKKNGGDPVQDYAKHQKQKQREQAKQAQKQKESNDWYANNQKEFAKKYPNVDVNKLIEDANFVKYVGKRADSETLVSLYEGYLELKTGFEKQAQDKAKQQLANAKATPGALSSTGTNESEFFTKEQVLKMSPAEIKKNFDKIRASQAKW